MKKIAFVVICMMLSCTQKEQVLEELKSEEVKLTSYKPIDFSNKNFDSISIYGAVVSYKFYQIKSDSIVYDFSYKIHQDTLTNVYDKNSYYVDSVLVNQIGGIFNNEKPKSYDDYDPPLPEAVYPSVEIMFYKNASVYKRKDFLIVSDTLEYSNDFYKAVDFLYILQIKNVQKEDVDEFVKNYVW